MRFFPFLRTGFKHLSTEVYKHFSSLASWLVFTLLILLMLQMLFDLLPLKGGSGNDGGRDTIWLAAWREVWIMIEKWGSCAVWTEKWMSKSNFFQQAESDRFVDSDRRGGHIFSVFENRVQTSVNGRLQAIFLSSWLIGLHPHLVMLEMLLYLLHLREDSVIIENEVLLL